LDTLIESKKSDEEKSMPLNDSFMGMLIHDVIAALERREVNDDQTSRRDLVRTLFAAIEGLVWVYRENVRAVANDIDPLSPIMELAFAEKTYSVDEKGHVQEQQRFISMLAMIRLASRVAEKICPELKIDFGVSGWTDLQLAIKVRNRITHPKSLSDLNITKGDIEISESALLWLLKLMESVMTATLSASKQDYSEFILFAEKLRSGDEEALALYRAALMAEND
jgi:hypothetical protein